MHHNGPSLTQLWRDSRIALEASRRVLAALSNEAVHHCWNESRRAVMASRRALGALRAAEERSKSR